MHCFPFFNERLYPVKYNPCIETKISCIMKYNYELIISNVLTSKRLKVLNYYIRFHILRHLKYCPILCFRSSTNSISKSSTIRISCKEPRGKRETCKIRYLESVLVYITYDYSGNM